MKEVKGDLIKLAKRGEFDVIVHGCNCFCTMGAGIAKSIKLNFKSAYKADLSTSKGDKGKLGTYSFSKEVVDKHEIIVVNAYTQFNYRGRGLKLDYDALKAVFRKIKADFGDLRIGYPMIGAGLAGGDWLEISKIIDTELEMVDHTLVIYDPN